ncbi:Protein SRG1 [Ananas comosus]|uniref:Protein SRG1 n=1 Tax=Ananas comosus TaxID=4615 RepID=A0A199W316_ANACO|nr:Protein SRG1 [Ananas comosus]
MAPVLCGESPAAVRIGHVEDIQELRRVSPAFVPERYVRAPEERPAAVAAAAVVGPGDVVNHGVEKWLMDGMEKVAREFFMLPLEEKEKYPMAPGTIQGYGHAFVFSEDQKLDWCNMLALGVAPPFIRNPSLWPTNPAHFSETLEMYSAGIRNLCESLLIVIAETLGLAPNTFGGMFGEAVQAVRMNYYPPCSRPDLVLGLSSHSDGSALTVLQQDAACAGLQILKDGTWVPVNPIPNALVINIGDTIEVVTNGRYKSVEHRAVTNEERDRLSVVTFYAPSYDVEVGPLAELVHRDQRCMYKRYNHGDYSRHYVTNKLQGKKTLEFAKIQVN